MNKLPNRVLAFAPRSKLTTRFSAAGPARSRRPAGAIVCQWRRDTATGRLVCSWSLETVESNGRADSQLRLASKRIAA
jgi:hypothetical protein